MRRLTKAGFHLRIPFVPLVFPVPPSPTAYPGKILYDFEAHDVFRHLVAELTLQSQPKRRAVLDGERLAVQFIGEDRLRVEDATLILYSEGLTVPIPKSPVHEVDGLGDQFRNQNHVAVLGLDPDLFQSMPIIPCGDPLISYRKGEQQCKDRGPSRDKIFQERSLPHSSDGLMSPLFFDGQLLPGYEGIVRGKDPHQEG
jgi:hypothetical protein